MTTPIHKLTWHPYFRTCRCTCGCWAVFLTIPHIAEGLFEKHLAKELEHPTDAITLRRAATKPRRNNLEVGEVRPTATVIETEEAVACSA